MVTDDSVELFERTGREDVVMRVKEQVGYGPINAGVREVFKLSGEDRLRAAEIWMSQLEKMLTERGTVTARDVTNSAARAVEHVSQHSGGDVESDFDFR